MERSLYCTDNSVSYEERCIELCIPYGELYVQSMYTWQRDRTRSSATSAPLRPVHLFPLAGGLSTAREPLQLSKTSPLPASRPGFHLRRLCPDYGVFSSSERGSTRPCDRLLVHRQSRSLLVHILWTYRIPHSSGIDTSKGFTPSTAVQAQAMMYTRHTFPSGRLHISTCTGLTFLTGNEADHFSCSSVHETGLGWFI